MTHTPYVTFEDPGYKGHHIKRVGCMKCNDTLGSKDAQGQFYFWTHKRDYVVTLDNGAIAHVPLCLSCFQNVTPADHDLFENTMKHGWLLEQAWLYKRFPQRGPESVMRAGTWAKTVKISKGAL